MDIDAALRIAAERNGWSATRVASETGRTESTAWRWMSGTQEMKASDYQTLRTKLPGFADLVDGKRAPNRKSVVA